MRKCFVHIGTHKTGSTSIQRAFTVCPDDLERNGFVYPHAGRGADFVAHHNIAWEIIGDARYDPQHGATAALLREIGRSNLDVILSSEDFCIAFRRPAAFKSFLGRLKQCGLHVVVIIYVRNQPDYFRSAYFELLKGGCSLPFDAYLSAVLRDETIRWFTDRENIAGGPGLGHYGRDLAGISANNDTEIVARSYDATRARSVVADFLSLVGLTQDDLRIDANLRSNEQMALDEAFALFFRNGTRRWPNIQEATIISNLWHVLDRQEIHMSNSAKKKIFSKFESSNQVLKSRFGVSEPADLAAGVRCLPDHAGGVPHLEDVFSTTMVQLIQELARTRGNAEQETERLRSLLSRSQPPPA